MFHKKKIQIPYTHFPSLLQFPHFLLIPTIRCPPTHVSGNCCKTGKALLLFMSVCHIPSVLYVCPSRLSVLSIHPICLSCLSMYLSVLSVCLSVLSVCQSCLSVLSVCQSCLSVRPVSLSILFVRLGACLSVHLPACLSQQRISKVAASETLFPHNVPVELTHCIRPRDFKGKQ